MPNYQIAVHRSDGSVETITALLVDRAQLRLQMAGFAGQLLKEEAASIWQAGTWRVQARDEGGEFLYEISVATDRGETLSE